MPWCPKCNAEYIDGIIMCHDCNVELVDEPVEIVEDKKNGTEISDEHVEEVVLTIIDDVVEFSYITTMLEDESIPYWVMEQGADQYFSITSGMKYYAKSIYVSQYDLDRAKEIVDSYVPEENIDDGVWEGEGYNEVEDEESYNVFDWLYKIKPQWVLLIGGATIFIIGKLLLWF